MTQIATDPNIPVRLGHAHDRMGVRAVGGTNLTVFQQFVDLPVDFDLQTIRYAIRMHSLGTKIILQVNLVTRDVTIARFIAKHVTITLE